MKCISSHCTPPACLRLEKPATAGVTLAGHTGHGGARIHSRWVGKMQSLNSTQYLGPTTPLLSLYLRGKRVSLFKGPHVHVPFFPEAQPLSSLTNNCTSISPHTPQQLQQTWARKAPLKIGKEWLSQAEASAQRSLKDSTIGWQPGISFYFYPQMTGNTARWWSDCLTGTKPRISKYNV